MESYDNIAKKTHRPFVQQRFPTSGYLVFFEKAPDEEAFICTIAAETYEAAYLEATTRWPAHVHRLAIIEAAPTALEQAKLEYEILLEPWPHAYHEAGHAIAVRHFGWRVTGVSLRPRVHSNGYRCNRNYTSMGQTQLEYIASPDSNKRTAQEQEAIFEMAGSAAETRFQTGRLDPDFCLDISADFVYCIDSDDCEEEHVRWLKARANKLVEAHWAEIEVIAKALVERRDLTGDEFYELVGESAKTTTAPR